MFSLKGKGSPPGYILSDNIYDGDNQPRDNEVIPGTTVTYNKDNHIVVRLSYFFFRGNAAGV